AARGDISRRALEALALEGYRDQTLTLYQVSEMLGLSRVETEAFWGQHHDPPVRDRRRGFGPRRSTLRTSVAPPPALAIPQHDRCLYEHFHRFELPVHFRLPGGLVLFCLWTLTAQTLMCQVPGHTALVRERHSPEWRD